MDMQEKDIEMFVGKLTKLLDYPYPKITIVQTECGQEIELSSHAKSLIIHTNDLDESLYYDIAKAYRMKWVRRWLRGTDIGWRGHEKKRYMEDLFGYPREFRPIEEYEAEQNRLLDIDIKTFGYMICDMMGYDMDYIIELDEDKDEILKHEKTLQEHLDLRDFVGPCYVDPKDTISDDDELSDYLKYLEEYDYD